jgi:hypothetical protein
MSSSIGRRREIKAARRKKLLAERRRQARAEAGGSLASRVQRQAQAPIHCCLLQEGLFERGMGTMVLARGTAATGLTMASFLLDVFCLGVKDVIFEQQMEASDLEDILAAMEAEAPLAEVEPAYARKLLRDLVAYAGSIGLEPAPEYKVAETLFGDVSADACDTRFEFGLEGRPLYVPGATETPAQVRQRLEKLRRAVGEDGFDFEEFDEAEAFAADEGELDGYDPAETPDPEEWLETDEDERTLLIASYHRHAGLHAENDEVHNVMHLVVENQIALDDPPTVRPAIQRLMAEGLDRHDAIHAVASVMAGFMFDAMRGKGAQPFSNEDYSAAVERLTAESWRAECAEEPAGEEP